MERFIKVVVAAGMAAGVLAAGCLTRPVVSESADDENELRGASEAAVDRQGRPPVRDRQLGIDG